MKAETAIVLLEYALAHAEGLETVDSDFKPYVAILQELANLLNHKLDSLSATENRKHLVAIINDLYTELDSDTEAEDRSLKEEVQKQLARYSGHE